MDQEQHLVCKNYQHHFTKWGNGKLSDNTWKPHTLCTISETAMDLL